MRPEIARLLKQADRDLDNARKNLTIQAYEVAAFLQNAETVITWLRQKIAS